MATSKPISTISYNSPQFLEKTLNDFVNAGVITAWFYVFHNGEPQADNDEALGKDHIHLLCMPNKCIDLLKFTSSFTEFNPAAPKLPFKCMPFRVSKPEEWFLYSLHVEEYLSMKGLEKEFHYSIDEVSSNNPDYCHMLYVEAIQSLKNSPSYRLAKAAAKEVPFSVLVRTGQIPVQQISNSEKFYAYFYAGRPTVCTEDQMQAVWGYDADMPFGKYAISPEEVGKIEN